MHVTSFSVSTACYLYCNFNSKYNTYMINQSDNSILMMDSDKPNYKESLCLKNRAGALCSQCAPGYSVVFGSSDCIRCSNWWLLMLIIYGAAGPLLIYLFYVSDIALSGGCYGCITPARKVVEGVARDYFSRGCYTPITPARQGNI